MAVKNRDVTFLVKVQNLARAALQQLRTDLSDVGSAGQAASEAAGSVQASTQGIGSAAATAAANLEANSAQLAQMSAQEVTAALNAEKLTQAQARTALVQERLATQAAKTAEAQSRANIAYANEEAALNRAVAAEQRAIASKERLAQATQNASAATEQAAARTNDIRIVDGNAAPPQAANANDPKYSGDRATVAKQTDAMRAAPIVIPTAKEFGGAKDAEDLTAKIAGLRKEVDPLGASYVALTAKQQLWDAALEKGIASKEEYTAATAAIGKAIDGLETSSALEKQAAAAGMSVAQFTQLKNSAAALRNELNPLQAVQQQFAQKQNIVNAALKAGIITGPAAKEATSQIAKGLKEAEEAAQEAGGGFKLTSGTIREFIVILRELARGDLTRLPGSLTIMAQRLGLITTSTFPLIAAVAAVAAVIGTLVVASAEGSNAANRFGNQLRLQGNFAGLTATSYQNMASKIAAATDTSVASNEKLISSLSSTNAFTSTQLQQLTTAAQQLSKATGDDAEETIKDFSKMAEEGPGKYAEAFQRAHEGIITPTQVRYIQTLEARGDKEQALAVLINDVTDGIAKNAQSNTNKIVLGWTDAINSISDYWGWLQRVASGTTTDVDALRGVNDQIERIQTNSKRLNDPNTSLLGKVPAILGQASAYGHAFITGYGQDGNQGTLKDLEAERDRLKARINGASVAGDTNTPEQHTTQVDRTLDRIKTGTKGLVDDTVGLANATAAYAKNLKDAQAIAADPRATKEQRALAQAQADRLKAGQADANKRLAQQYTPNAVKDGKAATTAENKAEREAAKEAREAAAAEEKYQNQLKALENVYVPIIGKQEQFDNNLALLTKAHDRYTAAVKNGTLATVKGALSDQAFAAAKGNLEEAMGKDSDAIGTTTRELNDQIVADRQGAAAKAINTQVTQLQNKMLKEGTAYLQNGQFVIAATTKLTQAEMTARYNAAKATIAQSVAQKALQSAQEAGEKNEADTAIDTAALQMPLDVARAWVAANKALQDYIRAGADAGSAGAQVAKDIKDKQEKAFTASLSKDREDDQDNIDSHAGDGLGGYASDKAVDLAKARTAAVRAGITDETKLNKVIADRSKVLDDEHKRELDEQGDVIGGLKAGVQDWMKNAADIAGAARQAVSQSLDNLATMFSDFATTGKLNIKDFVTSSLQMLTQLITKMLLLKALGAAFPSLVPAGTRHTGGMAGAGGNAGNSTRNVAPEAFMVAQRYHTGGMTGGPPNPVRQARAVVGTRHNGGMVGMVGNAANAARSVDPALFTTAKRFHTGGMPSGPTLPGLKPGEVPIIALETERVLNPDETKEYNEAERSGSSVNFASQTAGQTASSIGQRVASQAASAARHAAAPVAPAGGVNQNITLAPTFANDFGGLAQAAGQGAGMDPKQMAEMQKGFKTDVTAYMEKWVQNEQRPGGRLAPQRR